MSANGMLEKVLAPLLVGNWINSFLFMWEILQVVSYFKHYEDPIFLRLVVITAFTVDTWSTINSFIMVYLYHVTHWGSITYILIQHWPLPVSVLTVSITTSIVQAFLIYRYYGISKRWAFTVFLIIVLLGSITGGIGTTIGLFQFVPFGISPTANNFIKLWLTATSACGIFVAGGLVYELSRVRTAFKSTRVLVRRLVFNAIQAGLAPAIVCTITLGVYLHDPLSNVGMGIVLCAGRIYSLTMLWNLNMRRRNKATTSSGQTPGAPGDLSDSLQLTGIHIHRTAIVQIDENKVTQTKSYDDSSNSPREGNDDIEKREASYEAPQLESRILFPPPSS
ncbi:hypothetical protein CCMSSC00406_0008929 [Pleurotus cornucopiae]|uniref:Uncharacterized protein n=1 Tax=Pleurotus cornucopiae TaxID=5321 RepID=A0ACB7IUE6_PLECO|nr:hypothetical protein CCMSSC00406_0008929 [Pleurotus cornucopiae]